MIEIGVQALLGVIRGVTGFGVLCLAVGGGKADHSINSKNSKNSKSIFSALVGALGIAGCLARAAGSEELMLRAIEVLFIVICGMRFWKADRRKALFIGLVYEIAAAFGSFLVGAGLGILLHEPLYLEPGSLQGQISNWVLQIPVSAVVLACVIFFRNKGISEHIFLRVASAAALVGFFAIVSLSDQTLIEIPQDTVTMWLILSMVLFCCILVSHMNRQYEVEKELANLKSDQAELLEKDYKALNQMYAVNARLFHDLHNHIGILRQYLASGKYEEAEAYLDELQAPVREMTNDKWTGESAVDYLINSKSAQAAENGIKMQVQVEFPNHTNIKSADLCAIVGNLLDNAMEAAKQVPGQENRFIRLTIRRINQMLVIKVENGFAAEPVRENGELRTTKTDGGLHGWGLRSARAAAEKYEGTLQTGTEGQTFRAVVTISFQGIGQD